MNDDQFAELKWNDDIWEGAVTFERFREWGAALDEKDPPDTRPTEAPDRSPTKRQLEAREELAKFAQQAGGAEGEALASVMSTFLSNLAARESAVAQAPTTEPEPDEDAQEDEDSRLLREGTCTLYIETAEDKRVKPTKRQRAAWQAMVDRGDALWDELLERSFDDYRRQLPVRRKWWRAIYGDYLLDKRLPEVRTIEQFRRLIRPAVFRLKSPPDAQDTKATTPVEISLHVIATWEVDGLGVIIRDGRITEIGQVIDTVHVSQRERDTIDHPAFGVLRRIPSDDLMEYVSEWKMPKDGESGLKNARRVANRPWLGHAPFAPLSDFADVADMRAQYAHNRANADRPESRMRWEFANGEFELRVYAPPGEPPSAAQAAAWSAFKADEKRYGREMLDTIFNQYQETVQTRRQNWKDRYVDDVLPAITEASGMRELFQLIEIHVHPPDEQGRVTIGLAFVAAFDYSGFSAVWRDGKFVEWGVWDDAKPKS